MSTTSEISADYWHHDRFQEMKDITKNYLMKMSAEFEDYGEDGIKGPALYIAFIADYSIDDFAVKSSPNVWEGLDEDRHIDDDPDKVYDELKEMAGEDLAIVVWMDGKFFPYRVRFDSVDKEERSHVDLNQEWGARHMSAAETSYREEVVTTMTLSEDTGEINIFRDGGSFRSLDREEILEELEGE